MLYNKLIKGNNQKRRWISLCCVVIFLLCIVGAYLSYSFNSKPWHEKYIDYSNVCKFSTGGSQVIALIDSGISKDQEKLVLNNINLVNDYNYDENGHGTILLSLLKGNEANSINAIAEDVKVISIKIMDEEGKSDKGLLLKAIKWAIEQKATVINISMGSYLEDHNIQMAIQEAINNGITVIASSGDYETEDMLFPAKMEDVISVGALDMNFKVWDGTNASDKCDILAPGVEIKSVSLDGKLIYTTGTSQATAIVSG